MKLFEAGKIDPAFIQHYDNKNDCADGFLVIYQPPILICDYQKPQWFTKNTFEKHFTLVTSMPKEKVHVNPKKVYRQRKINYLIRDKMFLEDEIESAYSDLSDYEQNTPHYDIILRQIKGAEAYLEDIKYRINFEEEIISDE
ncbi:MAG: hypothetical protein LBM61_07470 [Prevotellaceae bacterium]|jgi:hypothetical protein|nr:hypothetical protein [Prevotellaceae bacterium]